MAKWNRATPQATCAKTCTAKKGAGTPPLYISQTCVASGMKRDLKFSSSSR